MSTQFLKDAAERAVKTFAQSLLAYFGASALDVLHANWTAALSVALGAVVLSLNLGSSGTASLTAAVEPAGKHEAHEL